MSETHKPWFFLLLILSLPKSLFGAFEIQKLSAKAAAWNDCYSSIANDPWGILYNPAQSARIKNTQIALGTSRPQLRFGGLKASSSSLLFSREAMGTAYGAGMIFTETNIFYREMTGLLNIAHRFGEEDDPWNLALGANLKILSLRKGDPANFNDPALTPKTFQRFTLDIGTHLKINRFHAGFSMQNALPAQIGSIQKDFIPNEIRLGLGARRLWSLTPLQLKVSPAAEFYFRNKDGVFVGGAEIEAFKFASILLGVGARTISSGFSVYLNQKQDFQEQQNAFYRLDFGVQSPLNQSGSSESLLAGMTITF